MKVFFKDNLNHFKPLPKHQLLILANKPVDMIRELPIEDEMSLKLKQNKKNNQKERNIYASLDRDLHLVFF